MAKCVAVTGQAYPWEAQTYWDNVVLYSSVVPEPASLCVLAMGGLALVRRKK